MVVKGNKIKSPSNLFKVLKKTYKSRLRPENAVSSIKQKPGESIRIFVSRIRSLLSKSGMHGKLLDKYCLTHLVNGARSDIAKQLVLKDYRKLKYAINFASNLEANELLGKPLKPRDSCVSTLKETGQNVHDLASRSVEAKVNVLYKNDEAKTSQMADFQEQLNAIAHQSQSSNFHRNQQAPTSRSSDKGNKFRGNNRSSNLICYHCNLAGHGYLNCFKASATEKIAIRDKLMQARREKQQGTSSSNSEADRRVNSAQDKTSNSLNFHAAFSSPQKSQQH